MSVGVCYRITGPWTETESAEVDHPDNPNSSKIVWPHDRACHVRGRGVHWYIPIAKKRMENREVLHPLHESNSLTAI
jgi:hypothetical protein